MNKLNQAISVFGLSITMFSASSALATELYLQAEHTVTLVNEIVEPTARGSCEMSDGLVPSFEVVDGGHRLEASTKISANMTGSYVEKLVVEHLGTTMTYENENNETVTHEYAVDDILLGNVWVYDGSTKHFDDVSNGKKEYVGRLPYGGIKEISIHQRFAEVADAVPKFKNAADYEVQFRFKCYTR